MVIILMGPSGCGKTTIGERLNKKLGWNFYDADDYHSKENVEKMSQGFPLTDEDRKPWLEGIAVEIKSWNSNQGNALLACSALKKSYRKLLGVDQKEVLTVFLKGEKNLLSERMQSRKGHYMNPNLLRSQLETLEEPEDGITVSIDPSPDRIADTIITVLNL